MKIGRMVGRVVALFLLVTATGCSSPIIKSGAPITLAVPESSNPDVLWIVRSVDAPKAKSNRTSVVSNTTATSSSSSADAVTTYYGLFACYRPTSPGFPECYLAKIMGENQNLVWPESIDKFDFPKLMIQSSPSVKSK